MKKLSLLIIIASIVISCGPKRMKCYGRKCVETSVKKQITPNT